MVAGGLAALTLPETLHQHLPQTLEEGELFGWFEYYGFPLTRQFIGSIFQFIISYLILYSYYSFYRQRFWLQTVAHLLPITSDRNRRS